MDTGTTNFTNSNGISFDLQDEDLGKGTAFGVSAGKYITDSFRLELEAIKRDGYDYDARIIQLTTTVSKADMETNQVYFINGFYDFQPFIIGNTPITPYLGGGMSISRNKIGTIAEHTNEVPNGDTRDGKTISQFAYKLSAGTLFNLTDKLSLDVNYQYVNLGEFESSVEIFVNGVRRPDFDDLKPTNGGEIRSQEIMVGLQYSLIS